MDAKKLFQMRIDALNRLFADHKRKACNSITFDLVDDGDRFSVYFASANSYVQKATFKPYEVDKFHTFCDAIIALAECL